MDLISQTPTLEHNFFDRLCSIKKIRLQIGKVLSREFPQCLTILICCFCRMQRLWCQNINPNSKKTLKMVDLTIWKFWGKLRICLRKYCIFSFWSWSHTTTQCTEFSVLVKITGKHPEKFYQQVRPPCYCYSSNLYFSFLVPN